MRKDLKRLLHKFHDRFCNLQVIQKSNE